jgi:hypothetical protein
MPNNIDQVKREIRAKGKDSSFAKARADIHETVITILLKWLAFFTNVDTGALAGNWEVVTSPSKAKFNPNARNVTRQPNAAALVKLEGVDGSKVLYIVNKTPYASYVNDGTRFQDPSRFVEMAILQTNLELKKFKINIRKIA